MTKDQVLFYLNCVRKEYESLSQEESTGGRIEGDWEELMTRAKAMLSEARLLGEG